jgi:hypothetical protein
VQPTPFVSGGERVWPGRIHKGRREMENKQLAVRASAFEDEKRCAPALRSYRRAL